MDNKKVPTKFYCKICDYSSSRESQWKRHISTFKHMELMDKMDKNKVPNEFVCRCGKRYIYQSGLCKHKTKCKHQKKHKKSESKSTPIHFSSHEELIHAVLKDNQDFKQLLIEQNTKLMELSMKNTVIHNNTNNTTNNNFNLQMFLNVQCKDALNITDFVDSLQLQIKDLEDTGRLGYVDGIANIILNGLTDLDISKRPIHCSDLKRETIYIKDKDIWEKENNDHNKLKLAIKTVAAKNIKQIPLWQKAHPEYNDFSSKQNDKYLKIVSNAMNGSTEEETQKNYNKIISKLAKETVIQKDNGNQ